MKNRKELLIQQAVELIRQHHETLDAPTAMLYNRAREIRVARGLGDAALVRVCKEWMA